MLMSLRAEACSLCFCFVVKPEKKKERKVKRSDLLLQNCDEEEGDAKVQESRDHINKEADFSFRCRLEQWSSF